LVSGNAVNFLPGSIKGGFMNRKVFIGLFIFISLCVLGFESIAQYTSHELEKLPPPDHYPKPGPGDVAIIKELQETNRLLHQQAELLKEQNRLMKDTLAKLEPVTSKRESSLSN
jgi:cell division protein FtsB